MTDKDFTSDWAGVTSVWRWMNRDLLKYNKWKVGSEPDGGQHCVVYDDINGGTFSDKICSANYDYLCSTEGITNLVCLSKRYILSHGRESSEVSIKTETLTNAWTRVTLAL